MPAHDSSILPDLSVVVPIYNEARVLPSSIPALVQHLEALGLASEVILVDDGSLDASPQCLTELSAQHEVVRALSHAQNRGKGAAVRTGCLAARGERVLFLDADLSVPLAEIEPLLRSLDAGNDMVLGSRRVAGSRIERHQPWLREQLGRGFTTITRLLLRTDVRDFTCGFKGFRREAARAIFERSTLDGWAFDAELVAIARAQGLSIAQIPVEWRHEDDSKVKLGAAVVTSLIELMRICLRRLRGQYR